MDNVKNLEKRIDQIEKRNKRVELDKAWEISGTRKVLIAVSTYIIIATYMWFVLGIDPWINALVPTAGFLLSTLALPFFKKLWASYWYKN